MLVALLGGATTNLFAQFSWEEFNAEIINEEWQCLDVAKSNNDGSSTDAKLIETPYGALLYGKFTEINGNTYNAVAMFDDNKIEPVSFSNDEFNQIFDVKIKGNEVIFVTNIGIYSWEGGDQLIPWGIDIDLNLDNANEERVYSKIYNETFIISGDIQYINGEPGFGAVIDLGSKGIQKIAKREGNTGGDFDLLGDIVWFSYNPSDIAATTDGVCIMGYDLSSDQEVFANIPFWVVGVGSIETINDTMYVVYSDFADLNVKMMKTHDGVLWGETVLFPGTSLFSFDNKLYSNPGPMEFVNGNSWNIIVDMDSTVMAEDVFFINGFWYGVSNPGFHPLKAEWGDDFSENLCAGDRFIAKLGQPEVEVSLEEVEYYSDLQIFISGENLIVKSNQTENLMFNVYDLTGKVVISKIILPGTNTVEFPFNNGIYIANKQKILKL